MEDVNKQLKKGVIEILVLYLLKDNEYYGYQLISELARKSKNFFQFKEGTLYPVLYRLEDAGWITSFWESPTDKRQVPRKYYKITPEGKSALINLQNTWINFAYNVNLVLN